LECPTKYIYKYANIEINAIQKRAIRKIGIDEFALKKGKNDYAVVIVDLETGSDVRLTAGLHALDIEPPKGFLDSLTVCSYPKGGTFTTKLDLKN
jgi:transposase